MAVLAIACATLAAAAPAGQAAASTRRCPPRYFEPLNYTDVSLRGAGYHSARVKYTVAANDIVVTYRGIPRLSDAGVVDRVAGIVWRGERVTFDHMILQANGENVTLTYGELAFRFPPRETRGSAHEHANLLVGLCGAFDIDLGPGPAIAIGVIVLLILTIPIAGIWLVRRARRRTLESDRSTTAI
jgi:hypothetical protein